MPDASTANDGSGATLRFQKMSAVLYALMLVLGGWTYVAWILGQDYRATLDTSRRRVEQFARGLGLQVEAMAFDGLGAATIGAAMVRNGLTGSDATAALGSGYTRALFVVDGAELTMTQPAAEDLANITGGFMTTLLASAESTWVGPIVETPSGKAFAVAQRTVIGGRTVWAGAWLSSRNFEKIFSDPNKPSSYLALATLDGEILGRFPPRPAARGDASIDDATVRAQLRGLPVRTTAFLVGKDAGGETFDYGAYRLAGLPLVAIASRSRHDAVAAWRPRRDKTVLFAALTTVVVLGFAVMLQLAFNRSLGNVQALAQARRSELEAKESLANELMLAQDAERRRLAGELHDGIGQTLSLLRNQVLLLRRTPLPPQAGEKSQTLLDLASEAIEDLRNVARSLRPMHLEEQGVTGALRAMLARVRTSSGLTLHARVEEVDDVITDSDATHLYRIAQEVVNNVIKHADATHLSIEMIRDIDMVELRIRDDGKGMPAEGAGRPKGIGLLSIGERCRMLGATLAITANHPSGTSVLIRVPIRSFEEAHA